MARFSRFTIALEHVVPRKFRAGKNVGTGKESNPREMQILSIDENILRESVWLTRVLNAKLKLLKLNCQRQFSSLFLR